MKIEVKSNDGLGVLQAFAKKIGCTIQNGRVEVPEDFGTGFMQGYSFDTRLRIMIMNYDLHQDFIIS